MKDYGGQEKVIFNRSGTFYVLYGIGHRRESKSTLYALILYTKIWLPSRRGLRFETPARCQLA